MTREEAIAIIENEKECVNRANKNDYCNRDCYNCELVKTDTEILTALDMAIKALEREPTDDATLKDIFCMGCEYKEQEPCDDCISRQAVIRWVKTECNPYGKPTLDFESGKKVIEHLKQMPPVTPQPKTGHWIATDEGFSPYQCSECRSIEFKQSNYCPNCGAKMVESQKSEDI